MIQSDWSEIKFLESATNLEALLRKTIGRIPSTTTTNHIAICLQHGRLFFELAASAPLQIQPLQIYYGVLSFAKAAILARTHATIDDITPFHGLSDNSKIATRVEDLSFRIQRSGVFQQFNDVVALLGCIKYYDGTSMPQSVRKPFDKIEPLCGQEISIKEVLSRTPGLHIVYEKTFGEEAHNWPLSFSHLFDQAELRIDDPHIFTNRETLIALVRKWRGRFPFLERWCFCEGVKAWGNTALIFHNIEKPEAGEFSEQFLVEGNSGFSVPRFLRSKTHIPFDSILPALAGGITDSFATAMEPLNSVSLSEFSLQFCGSFILSSLVRYRPQIWQHALSRSSSLESPADDRTLALIEQFLQIVFTSFPKLVVHTISASNYE